MRPRLPEAIAGERHHILSIDGGGVRGMIPVRVLMFLEQKLNELDPEAKGGARIADYFDLIAGTSAGGLLASLLATPDNNGKLRSAKEICKLFFHDAGRIFPQDTIRALALEDAMLSMEKVSPEREENITPTEQELAALIRNQGGELKASYPFEIPEWLWKLLPKSLNKLLIFFWMLQHPIYDGEAVRQVAKEHFGNKKMNETATEILVTAFDIHKRHPVTFSTSQAKDPNQNVMVKDACISTSAAPVYLPPYYFTYGKSEHNTADGGISANNPSMVALMSLINKHYGSKNITIEALIMAKKHRVTTDREENEEKKMEIEGPSFPTQMLSLGCGEGQRTPYSASETWPAWKWFFYPRTREVSLLNFLMEAGSDIVHVQAQLVFQFLNGSSYPNGYLRVQEYNLPEKNSRIDNGAPSNMNELEQIGDDLILKNAKKMNPITYEPEDLHDSMGNVIKNKEALELFASSLVKERKKRLARAMSAQ